MKNKLKNDNYLYIPKPLLFEEQFKGISLEAKILYALMLDRLNSADKNHCFDEKKMQTYIYYTIQEIRENFCCATAKAVKLLSELEELNLIEKKRQGSRKPNKIFLNAFVEDNNKKQQ